MKKLFLILLIAFGFTTHAQNTNCPITIDGIGAIKINMTQDELEAMFKQKFTLINALTKAVSFCDTASVTLGNAKLDLFFQRAYKADTSFSMYLTGLKTYSPLCKTSTGIAVGATKMKVLAAYKSRKKNLVPACENEDCTKLSKTRSHVFMKVNADRQLLIYLVNDKVVAIEVSTLWDDEE